MVKARVIWTEWKAPTTNTDGTPINDIAGYKLYISIPRPSETPSGISNLPVVTIDPSYTKWPFWIGINDAYYVQLSTVNKAGRESVKTPRVLIKANP